MLEWFFATLEYQNWGFNALTIGSLGTLFFTGIEGWGLIKQNDSIWKARSGESVSIKMFSFLSIFLATFGIYGFYIRSLSVIINGFILGAFHVPILWGLWKFKGFSVAEKGWFALSALMIPAMIILPWKDETYLVIMFGTLVAFAAQPNEIWQSRSAGVVDVRLLVVYLVSTVFWMVYSFSIHKLSLQISSTCTLFLLVWTLALWFRFRKNRIG